MTRDEICRAARKGSWMRSFSVFAFDAGPHAAAALGESVRLQRREEGHVWVSFASVAAAARVRSLGEVFVFSSSTHRLRREQRTGRGQAVDLAFSRQRTRLNTNTSPTTSPSPPQHAGKSPQHDLLYVSGAAPIPPSAGRSMWARVKGKTENDLSTPFRAAYMFRPGVIQPLHAFARRRSSTKTFYTVLNPHPPLLKSRPFPNTSPPRQ